MIASDPVTGDILVSDLGSDTVFAYALDRDGRLAAEADAVGDVWRDDLVTFLIGSGISIGALSQRSTYSVTHFESVCRSTAFSIRSHGTESKKALTSRSTTQSLLKHRSRHVRTASSGDRLGR